MIDDPSKQVWRITYRNGDILTWSWNLLEVSLAEEGLSKIAKIEHVAFRHIHPGPIELREYLVQERDSCLANMERITKEGGNYILSDWFNRNIAIQAKINRIDEGILGGAV